MADRISENTPYTHEIKKDSPHYPLLEYLHEKGVADSELDVGYWQIDYYRPGEKGYIEGAGDHFIDFREVMRHYAENWRELSQPMKEHSRMKILWDKRDDIKDIKEVDSKKTKKTIDSIRETATQFIREDLNEKGLSPDSDKYRTSLADAMNLWFKFPNASTWKTFEDVQKEEIIKRLKVDQVYLPRFKRHLFQEGGAGNYMLSERVKVHFDYKPFNVQAPFIFDNSPFALYYLFDQAGLKPSFVELTGLHRNKFFCGRDVLSRLGVGIRLSEGWRNYDPMLLSMAESDEIFYPLSLRQALTAYYSTGQMFTALHKILYDPVTGKEVKRIKASADGITSAHLMFTGAAAAAEQMEAEGDSQKSFIEFIKQVFSDKKTHHPSWYTIVSLMGLEKLGGGNFNFKEILKMLGSHPGIPKHGLIDYCLLPAFVENLKNDVAFDKDEFKKCIHHLLELDPKCGEAHYYIAFAGMKGKWEQDDASIEEHFSKAASVMPKGCKEINRIYYHWGKFEMERGELDDAANKFNLALSNQSGELDLRMKSAYLLAVIYANKKDLKKAQELMAAVVGTCRKKLMDIGNKDICYLLDWLVEQGEKHPFSKDAIDDQDLTRALAFLYSYLGSVLLFNGDKKRAETAYRMALKFATRDIRYNLLVSLHETLVQQGKLEEAGKIWREFEEGIFPKNR